MGVSEIRKKETPTMARRGLANLFSFKSASSFSSSFPTPDSISMSPSPHRSTFSESIMEENIANAQAMIIKWDPSSPSNNYINTSLFQQDRKEAIQFIKCVKDLRRAMHFFVSDNHDSSRIIDAHNLTEIAMRRLEKEFYLILSSNRQYLDSESVSSPSSRLLADSFSRGRESPENDYAQIEEEIRMSGESVSDKERHSHVAMMDLKLIADCMISSGYGKESVKIYKLIRKSIVDEQLYGLGIVKHTSSTINNKMNSDVFEHHVKNWLDVIKTVMQKLFHGEKLLCDHVFSASNTMRESCFTHVIKDAATDFFRFPELIAKSKRSPDRIFRLMDLHESISDFWPEIESIFTFESVSVVKSQALNSLHKLADSVQLILSEFEVSIQKNPSKVLVPGGGVHPLTVSAMNYISIIANYSGVLTNIIGDSTSPTRSPLPESYFESPTADESPTPTISVRLAWMILILLCKLDSKADLYNDMALAYLFLANNLQFVVEKVRSTSLKLLLGKDWLEKHEKKVRQYAESYEMMAWSKVLSTLPEESSDGMSAEYVKQCFGQFNFAFEEVYRKQMGWVVQDSKLRDDIKVSIANNIVPAYREFYDTHLGSLSGEENLEVLVRFSPDNLGNYLSDLFHGNTISGGSTTSTSSPSSSSSRHSRGIRCLP